jgi:hypothetical protein
MKKILGIGMIIIIAAALLQGGTQSYVLSRSFILDYGYGPYQLGLLRGGEIPPLGPNAFAVDKNGDIFIADPINDGLKVFSPGQGRMIKFLYVPGIYDDILPDRDGNVFLLERTSAQIIKIDQWEEKSSVPIDAAFARHPCSLFLAGGSVLVKGRGDTYIPRTQKILPGITLSNGKSCWTEYRDEHLGVLNVFDRTSGEIVSFPVVRPSLASIVFLGVDRQGCYYVQTEFIVSESRVGLEVQKLGPRGELLATIPIPENDYAVWTSRLLAVDEDGAIYQVLPRRENVKIHIWIPEGGPQ